jgi:hypothetical protein
MSLDTPIAFFIFDRPDPTARVFERIAQAQPRRLLIVADGPRDKREIERCETTRRIVECIHWPCEVERNYAHRNLGCRKRIASGLDWVFDRCERAIVLEDDCLPHPTFFRFAQELLDRYVDDERIGQISGDNFQFGQRRFAHSYYFSRLNHIWGWATWRRAWRLFDESARRWSELRTTDWLERHLENPTFAANTRCALEKVWRGELDTWDVQWVFALWQADALTVLPAVNLVTNIGFGTDATHTRSSRNICANLPVEGIKFPLSHPAEVARDAEADHASLRLLLDARNL